MRSDTRILKIPTFRHYSISPCQTRTRDIKCSCLAQKEGSTTKEELPKSLKKQKESLVTTIGTVVRRCTSTRMAASLCWYQSSSRNWTDSEFIIGHTACTVDVMHSPHHFHRLRHEPTAVLRLSGTSSTIKTGHSMVNVEEQGVSKYDGKSWMWVDILLCNG